MKKFLILLLTLALILGIFASCNSNLPIDDETSSSPSESTTTEDNQGGITTDGLTEDTLPDFENETTNPGEVKYVTSYEVKKVGDQWYMIFDSYVANPSAPVNPPLHSLFFDSITVLRNNILNYKLTLSQMNTIVTYFVKDDIGVPIFDVEELYFSNLGDSFVVENGETYTRSITWNDGECFENIYYLDTDDDNDYEFTVVFNMFSKNEFEEYSHYINNNHSPKIIQTESKTVYIFRHDGVFMLVNEGKYYYRYYILEYSFDVEDFPDDESLLSYGIEKYEG